MKPKAQCPSPGPRDHPGKLPAADAHTAARASARPRGLAGPRRDTPPLHPLHPLPSIVNTLLHALVTCHAPALHDLLAVCHDALGSRRIPFSCEQRLRPALSDGESCSIGCLDGVPPCFRSANGNDVLGTGTWGTSPSSGCIYSPCHISYLIIK